jgi:hypothetical protein
MVAHLLHLLVFALAVLLGLWAGLMAQPSIMKLAGR